MDSVAEDTLKDEEKEIIIPESVAGDVLQEEEKLDIVVSPGTKDNIDVVDSTYIDASGLSTEALRTRALTLRENINKTAIDLADVLHAIYHGEKWRDFGFASFEKYVESDLEVGYRSAMMSVKIISAVKEHGITMQQARQLGWGRLRALLPHITSKNIGSLLDMASSRSVREIQTELGNNTALTRTTTTNPETHQLTFNCTASEASIVLDAIDEAKKRLSTESTSSALEFIAQEWSVANEGDSSQVSLQDIIDFCERNYGVVLELTASSGKEEKNEEAKNDGLKE